MESKIRIKIKDLEIEFEGTEAFLKEELPNLLETVSNMFLSHQAYSASSNVATPAEETIAYATKSIEFTVNTIAAKLNVTDGPGLILAAAAHLIFVQKKDKFHRKDLLQTMQSATNYYKTSYRSNLTGYLKTMIKNEQLIEQSKDIYALPAKVRKELEAKIA